MNLEEFLREELREYALPKNKTLEDAIQLFLLGTNKAQGWYSRIAKPYVQQVPRYIPRRKYLSWFLLHRGLKSCGKCSQVIPVTFFHINVSHPDGLESSCKSCRKKYAEDNKEYLTEYLRQYYIKNKDSIKQKDKIYATTPRGRGQKRATSAKRRAAKLNATPSWVDHSKIKEAYAKCPVGKHVDHIIPLQGDLVSGLHIAANLQILGAKENLQKSNKFDPLIEGRNQPVKDPVHVKNI